MHKENKLLYHIFALVVVTAWATSLVSSKYLIGAIEPSELLFIRFILGYIALSVIERPHLLKKEDLKSEIIFIVGAIVGNLLFYLLQTYALKYSSAGNVSIIGALAPLFTVILNRIFLKTRISMRFFSGFLFAIAGIVAVEASNIAIAATPIGEILAFLSAVCWAFYSLILMKVDSSYSNIAITRKLFFYSALFMAPYFMVTGIHVTWNTIAQPSFYLNVLYLALVCSALCYVLWNTALKELGNKTAMTYVYLQPMISLIAASALIQERITMGQCIGIALIIVGLVISQTDKQ